MTAKKIVSPQAGEVLRVGHEDRETGLPVVWETWTGIGPTVPRVIEKCLASDRIVIGTVVREYVGGLTSGNFRLTASQSIHSAELINLRVHIGRYPRSSLLLCAIGEFLRFYLGRWHTLSLNRPVGV